MKGQLYEKQTLCQTWKIEGDKERESDEGKKQKRNKIQVKIKIREWKC